MSTTTHLLIRGGGASEGVRTGRGDLLRGGLCGCVHLRPRRARPATAPPRARAAAESTPGSRGARPQDERRAHSWSPRRWCCSARSRAGAFSSSCWRVLLRAPRLVTTTSPHPPMPPLFEKELPTRSAPPAPPPAGPPRRDGRRAAQPPRPTNSATEPTGPSRAAGVCARPPPPQRPRAETPWARSAVVQRDTVAGVSRSRAHVVECAEKGWPVDDDAPKRGNAD